MLCLIYFESNDRAKIYSLNNNLNIITTEMNPYNQSYLNHLDEKHPSFLKISSMRENNPRSNKNVIMQSPLNQFREIAAVFR